MKIINPYIHPKREELWEIFSITEKEALTIRRRYMLSKKKHYEERINSALHLRLCTGVGSLWFVDDILRGQRSLLGKLVRALEFNSRRIKEADLPPTERTQGVCYDKDAAKTRSCRHILEDHGVEIIRGKFKLRNERTPSCALYANDTRWQDYGSGEGGDVIDLYMKLNNCDFVTAIKELQ